MKTKSDKAKMGKGFKIKGDMTISTVAGMRAAMIEAFAGADAYLLDLSGVHECDTAGISLLLAARASAVAVGKEFAVVGSEAPSITAVAGRIGVPLSLIGFQVKE